MKILTRIYSKENSVIANNPIKESLTYFFFLKISLTYFCIYNKHDM